MASQRRRNRNRTRRRNRGRFRALSQLLAIFAVVVAVAVGCIVFFRTETITVSGNYRYTAEEVIQSSGLEMGDYLVLLDKSQIARRIRSNLPYVEAVSIRRSLPDTVWITVTESTAVAAVETESGWWLINSAGKLLEQVETPGNCAILTGFSPNAPLAGVVVTLPEEEIVRWDYALSFFKTLVERDMLDGLTQLDCTEAGTFTAVYDRFTLIFPSTGNFKEYLAMFTRAVEDELESNEQGTFDFTHYDTTGNVYFRHKT